MEKGADVHKICFNAGDRFFWRNNKTRSDFLGTADDWPVFIHDMLKQGYTDLVIYGDNRPVHIAALECAQTLDITIHYFEEGYLRPYWATYEREGVNGSSCLLKIRIDEMRKDLAEVEVQQPSAPVRWGDMRQHILLGAVYHWHIMFRNKDYPNYVPHRDNSVGNEFQLHLLKILNRLPHAIQRRLSTKRLVNSGMTYHLGILQLSVWPKTS